MLIGRRAARDKKLTYLVVGLKKLLRLVAIPLWISLEEGVRDTDWLMPAIMKFLGR